jgi:hypothetical protein
MNDLYQRIQLAGEQQDQKDILACLEDIQQGRRPNDLKLVNYYQEIPVSYAADILTIEETSVEFLVHQVQAVAISMEKVTILKSSHFPRDVVANVNYVNVEKSRIVLSNFSYGVVRADRRMSVRVAFNDKINTSFRGEQHYITGRLNDMSLTGMSIDVPENPGFELTERGELLVALPSGSVALTASLLKILPSGSGMRFVFEIELDRAGELAISQFIFRRQVEIIKELKEHPGLNQ